MTVLKKHAKLRHLSITVSERSIDYFLKSILLNPSIKSLSLPQSKFTESSIDLLCRYLVSKKSELRSLDLSQTFLDPMLVFKLGEMLKLNSTIETLNLSSNGLNSRCGIFILEGLAFNNNLKSLNLSYNELHDRFCRALSFTLTSNATIIECDITGNPFTNEGATELIQILSSKASFSFGDISKNDSLSVDIRERLRGGAFLSEIELVSLRSIEELNPEENIEVLPWNLTNSLEA